MATTTLFDLCIWQCVCVCLCVCVCVCVCVCACVALCIVCLLRRHGKVAAVYESAATRRFKKGRTETIRSQSPECLTFCKAMGNPNSTVSVLWDSDSGDGGWLCVVMVVDTGVYSHAHAHAHAHAHTHTHNPHHTHTHTQHTRVYTHMHTHTKTVGW